MKYGLYLLIICTLVAPAWADPQSKSFSSWSMEQDQLVVNYRISLREVTRLPDAAHNADLTAVLAAHLQQQLSVTAEQACILTNGTAFPAGTGYLNYRASWRCPEDAASAVISIGAFFQAAPAHIHFARFRLPEQAPFERLYTRHNSSQRVQLQPGADQSERWQDTFLAYVSFGFEHILIGLDHIAFLLTLLILAQRLRDVIFIVTGFTLGHSVTLSMTVLGLATPSISVIEAFIGFTIAFVAVENVAAENGQAARAANWTAAAMLLLTGLGAASLSNFPVVPLLGLSLFAWCYLRLAKTGERARAMRPAITTLFGLIHGFGFASVLLEVGLPEQAIVPALVGFNIGVELGQIAIVLALVAIAALWRRWLPGGLPAAAVLNASLCAIGSYWFVQRLISA